MAKTSSMYIRLDPALKADVESIYAHFGMTLTQAITTFLHQSRNVGGFPFDLRQPRYAPEVEAAMLEALDIASGKIPAKSYATARELFAELDAELEAEGC